MSGEIFNDRLRFACLSIYLVFTKSVLAENYEDFYIVFLRNHSVNETSTLEAHLNVLTSLKESEDDASECHVYSYTQSFNAFAAKLSEDEATKLSDMDEVKLVIRNGYRKLQTTRSWDFVGLTPNSKRTKAESDVIIGIIDTGIAPQSESFNDEGFGLPPSRWKGSCGPFANFSCNNKLIGAKYFKLDNKPDPKDILSPIDVKGHGTHTSSTAAGNSIPNANVFGLAQGTARGAVPSARIAVYKVCWASTSCSDMDVLAAFEAAISDGVDIISISIGAEATQRYTEDTIAIGAFHASTKGILTVSSAGNRGPVQGTVVNHAPWIFTVAASGIDRQFMSKVVLGNGVMLSGLGVSTIEPNQTQYPLASGIDVANNASDPDEPARYCEEGSMNSSKVIGKIIYCDTSYAGTDSIVKDLGGVGTVLVKNVHLDVSPIFMAPSTIVTPSMGETINKYIHSTTTPSAIIHKSEGIKINAPFAASFSSRGPSNGSRSILKPDIAAPGIDILASYTPLKSLTGRKGDTQYSKFNFMTGTSMSCPHVAGAAAYVKSFNPSWTPAAIKSALMTTATPMSSKVDRDAEFAYGSGQVNPTQAIRPGLVYDMDDMSYVKFLCHEGYNDSCISSLIGHGDIINCSKFLPKNKSGDALNYPTMQLALKSDQEPTMCIFRRTVTNVGPPKSYYNSTIEAPNGVDIKVTPGFLLFSKALEKRSFKVMVKAKPMPKNVSVLSGALTWKSSRHTVRSPIAIYNPNADHT